MSNDYESVSKIRNWSIERVEIYRWRHPRFYWCVCFLKLLLAIHLTFIKKFFRTDHSELRAVSRLNRSSSNTFSEKISSVRLLSSSSSYTFSFAYILSFFWPAIWLSNNIIPLIFSSHKRNECWLSSSLSLIRKKTLSYAFFVQPSFGSYLLLHLLCARLNFVNFYFSHSKSCA